MRATPKTLLPESVQDVGKTTCRWLLSARMLLFTSISFEILDHSSPAFLVGAVASRIEKVAYWQHPRIFVQTVGSGFGGEFTPPKKVVVGAVFCADASRFVGQKLVWNGLPQKGSARNQEDDVIPILLYTS